MDIVIGIDLGTQGVRMLAVSAAGEIVAAAHEKHSLVTAQLPSGWAEQDPLDWWRATITCIRHLMSDLPAGAHVAGIAVDSTSATILPIDAHGHPLHAALMYNDARSQPYVASVRAAAAELEERLGYAFNSSFALPKIVWLTRELPQVAAQTHLYIHATDFLTGRLSGEYGVTNYSDALKTGYDLLKGEWPPFIERSLGVPIRQLPRVVAPGQFIGTVSKACAEESGLPAGVPIYGGATDGTAAQIASGAVELGAWNSSLGTTLVVKGITEQLLRDPQQRIYSHRHPEGWWMPGGASNTGSEWMVREFAGQDFKALDAQAATLTPTPFVRYPLARLGERFPFLHAQAKGFIVDQASGQELSQAPEAPLAYAAGLEGTALVERLIYDTLRQIGAPVGDCIHVTGGGSNSNTWLRMRASALNRQLIRPASSETAMGAALLAASGAWFGNLGKAAAAMVKPDMSMDPDPALSAAYEEKYAVFCAQLKTRGYLSPNDGR
jgi:sugar (pentulose or hexulose) kinase